mmetsp:Transcript_22492/g.62433  ORF Transcript_22492/g.62433 Transcript_22492/m.62433 type:complete len:108 (-) Transcript_22492:268-591(-)
MSQATPLVLRTDPVVAIPETDWKAAEGGRTFVDCHDLLEVVQDFSTAGPTPSVLLDGPTHQETANAKLVHHVKQFFHDPRRQQFLIVDNFVLEWNSGYGPYTRGATA